MLCVHYAVFDTPRRVVWLTGTCLCVLSGWLCRWLIAAGKRPVPFRTRKLSLRRADGTALGRVWESRLLPTLYNFIFFCLFGPWLGALWWCAWFTGHKHIRS